MERFTEQITGDDDVKRRIHAACNEVRLMMDACNLSGVISAYQRIYEEVLNPVSSYFKKGFDWRDQNAISVVMADKIAQLSGGAFLMSEAVEAYKIVVDFSDWSFIEKLPVKMVIGHLKDMDFSLDFKQRKPVSSEEAKEIEND